MEASSITRNSLLWHLPVPYTALVTMHKCSLLVNTLCHKVGQLSSSVGSQKFEAIWLSYRLPRTQCWRTPRSKRWMSTRPESYVEGHNCSTEIVLSKEMYAFPRNPMCLCCMFIGLESTVWVGRFPTICMSLSLCALPSVCHKGHRTAPEASQDMQCICTTTYTTLS